MSATMSTTKMKLTWKDFERAAPLRRIRISKEDQKLCQDIMMSRRCLRRIRISKKDQAVVEELYAARSEPILNRLAGESNISLTRRSKKNKKHKKRPKHHHRHSAEDHAEPFKIPKLVIKMDKNIQKMEEQILDNEGPAYSAPKTTIDVVKWDYPFRSFVVRIEDIDQNPTRPKKIFRVCEAFLKPYTRAAEGYQPDYLDAEGFLNIPFHLAQGNEYQPIEVTQSEGITVHFIPKPHH